MDLIPARNPRRQFVAGALIFITTLAVFLLSQVNQVSDSRYSLLVSHSLLQGGRLDISPYAIADVVVGTPGVPRGARAYQFELVNGRVYYYFPIGSSVLSIPFVAVANVLGVSVVDQDGAYQARTEDALQRTFAALLMASFSWLVFSMSSLLLSVRLSLLTSFGCALGTQVWSTASRALWSDTWGIVLVGLAVYFLVQHETGRRPLRPMLLASLLAWAYIVRPTNSIAILCIAVYLFAAHRATFSRFALCGGAWAIAFVGYSFAHFGQALPSYYLANRLTFDSFWTALAGNLVSPSRGLFVFVPTLLFVAYLLIRYRRHVELRGLAALALCIVAAHIVMVSGFGHWWGGHSYGPRLLTGLVPWFALLGMLALRARLMSQANADAGGPPVRTRRENVVGSLLLFISIAIHLHGATNARAYEWNAKPVDVDFMPSRLWDWSDPQFLRR